MIACSSSRSSSLSSASSRSSSRRPTPGLASSPPATPPTAARSAAAPTSTSRAPRAGPPSPCSSWRCVFLVFSSFFRQDVGQANVLRDWTGNIVGTETASGLHPKAPVGRRRHLRRAQPAGGVRQRAGARPGRQHRRRARRSADHGAGCRGRHREHRHRDPLQPRSRRGQRHLQRVLQRGEPAHAPDLQRHPLGRALGPGRSSRPSRC